MNKQLMILLAIMSFFSYTFADTNGIWTYAEDIRPGIFGDDEVGSNFTFNDVVYFNQDLVYKSTRIEDLFLNRSGDSMSGNLNMNNNNITNVGVLKGDRLELLPGFVKSQMGAVFAESYYTRGEGTNYYLRPANTSKINNLRVINNLEYAGTSIDNVFVNENQTNSISSSMIQNNAVGSSEIASDSVRVQELDTGSVDNRYVNRGGDSMSGNLDMDKNNIENAGNVESSQYCDENGNNCFTASNSGNPTGTIISFASTSCPSGYVAADGRSLSKSSYSQLHSVIGNTWGSTSSTFRVPDLRGEFIRGYDDGRGVDSGRSFGSSQEDLANRFSNTRGVGSAHPSHKRNKNVVVPSDGSWSNGAYLGEGGSPRQYMSFRTSGDETRPRNVALQQCIRY